MGTCHGHMPWAHAMGTCHGHMHMPWAHAHAMGWLCSLEHTWGCILHTWGCSLHPRGCSLCHMSLQHVRLQPSASGGLQPPTRGVAAAAAARRAAFRPPAAGGAARRPECVASARARPAAQAAAAGCWRCGAVGARGAPPRGEGVASSRGISSLPPQAEAAPASASAGPCTAWCRAPPRPPSYASFAGRAPNKNMGTNTYV
jgi:hypothetical protein